MKNRFIVIIVVQTVLMAVFLFYAIIQKMEADQQTFIAVEASKNAKRLLELAEKSRKVAEEQMYKSQQIEQMMVTEVQELKEQLKKCR